MSDVLMLRRHAESLANAARRIQGRSTAGDLTAAGRAEAQAWAERLAPGSVDVLWSSDAVRARSTARIVADRLGVPSRVHPVLAEAGAGVLEGVPHEEARISLSGAHRVWLARGDLDAIPGAEPGEQVQARAVAFLSLVGDLGGRHLAVTHAAFLRCLVNTAARRDRTLPVAVGHGDTHELVEPWARLGPVPLGQPWRPAVHAVDTGPGGRYVTKRIRTDDLDRYLRIQEAVGAPVLAAAPDRDDTVLVRRHLPGSPVPHRVAPATEWELLAHYRAVSGRIDAGLTSELRIGLPSLAERVAQVLAGPDSEAAAGLRVLTADSRVAGLLAGHVAVADFDMHRDNTLSDDGRLHRIDFDGLCLGPETWPEACSLVGASALYPAAGDGRRPHDGIDGELRILVLVRLLLGLSYFLTGDRAAAPVGHYTQLYRDAVANWTTEVTA
ncbi:histidine phosphatase family protein [Streptomyces sp. NPDC001351]|uniref:histidine phosphatase family protein n=1 Tax=Streptomyces sp. NPDC001351 TaxID=3364564 RepID=UPI0036BBD8CA